MTRTVLCASAIRWPQAAPLKPPNTSEWITPSRAQASIDTGSSGTIGMWNVTRSPVLTPGEVPQQRGELVDAPVELRVGDLDGLGVLGLGHPDHRVLVAAGLEVPVDAVDARVQPPAHEPLEERRIARVEERVPLPVPGEHVGVLDEAVRELLLAEALEDRLVVRVGLRREARPAAGSTPPRASGPRSAPPRPRRRSPPAQWSVPCVTSAIFNSLLLTHVGNPPWTARSAGVAAGAPSSSMIYEAISACSSTPGSLAVGFSRVG